MYCVTDAVVDEGETLEVGVNVGVDAGVGVVELLVVGLWLFRKTSIEVIKITVTIKMAITIIFDFFIAFLFCITDLYVNR